MIKFRTDSSETGEYRSSRTEYESQGKRIKDYTDYLNNACLMLLIEQWNM